MNKSNETLSGEGLKLLQGMVERGDYLSGKSLEVLKMLTEEREHLCFMDVLTRKEMLEINSKIEELFTTCTNISAEKLLFEIAALFESTKQIAKAKKPHHVTSAHLLKLKRNIGNTANVLAGAFKCMDVTKRLREKI